MPFNKNTGRFERLWNFVDQREAGDDITRSDLDAAANDLAAGITDVAALHLNYVGEWNPEIASFPASRPNGGRIMARDAFVSTGDGTVGGVGFAEGETLVALVPDPGQTYAARWLRVPQLTYPAQIDLATRAIEAAAAAEESEDAAAVSAIAALASQVASTASASAAATDAATAAAAAEAVGEANWFSVDAYGAVGDGASDDAPAILAALTAAQGRPLIGRAGAIYRFAAAVDFTGNADLDLSMSRWICDVPNVRPITVRAPGVTGPYVLTSDYLDGTMELQVAEMPTAPKAGSRIHVSSNARDPGNRDEGSSAAQYRVAEQAFVGEGSTTTVIRLATPLRFLRGIHPTSTAGDEAEVAPYTTAMGARVVLLADEAYCRIKLGRGGFSEGHDSDPSPIWRSGAVAIYGFKAPSITLEVDRGYGPAVTLAGTYGALVDQPVFGRLEDDTTQSQFGYGVLDKGWATQVRGMRSHDVRHAYTTGADTIGLNSTDKWALLSVGRVVGALVQGCHATGGVAAPYDTHACAEDVSFVDCSAEGVGAAPFGLRGRNIHLVRPKVRSSSGGVLAFTEYDNDDPDDDIYNNGKTVADFTSVVIDSPDIECTGDAIVANAASVEMVGRGRIRSTSHRFITLNGGALTVYNHQSLVAVGGAAPNATACITVTPAAAAALGAFPTSIVTLNRGAALDIDARGSTSTLPDLISAASGTKVMVEGLLRPRMPNIISMALARVECSGPGLIEYSLANSVTIADLALTGLPVRLKDVTTGEQFDGTGDTDFYHGYTKRLAVTADGVSVSGNVYSAGLLAGTAPLADRATAAAATIPLVQQVTSYRGPNGSLLQFVRDASGTALTTAGGVTWSPAQQITPHHFGAIGNNVTNDTEAMQACFDYAASSGKLCVYIPNGTYRVRQPLLIKAERMLFEGESFENTIIRAQSPFPDADYLIRTDPAVATEATPLRRSIIRNLRFEGGAGATRASGIGLIDSALHTVEYCAFQGCRKDLVVKSSAPLGDITEFQPGAPLIQFNRFESTEEAVYLVGNTQNFITNNWFVSGSTTYIYAENTDKTRIICNEFNSWSDKAIHLVTTDPALPTRMNIIIGNSFHGAGLSAIVEEGAGTNWNIITGNQMRQSDPITVIGPNTMCLNNNGAPDRIPTVGGTANEITLALGGVETPWTGQRVIFTAGASNTSGATISINGGTAVSCRTITGVTLPAGYIRAGQETEARFDGTYWVVDRQIERGSNANGDYVRFADGTQICVTSKTANLTIATAFLGGFRSTGQTWVYPAEFSAAPSLAAEVMSVSAFGAATHVAGTTTTGGWLVTAVASQAAADRTVTLTANGWWY